MEKIIYQCDIDGEPARLIQSSDGSAEIIYKGESLQKISAFYVDIIAKNFDWYEIVHLVVDDENARNKRKKEFLAAVEKLGW